MESNDVNMDKNQQINPLGQVSAERYQEGSWALALLKRMRDVLCQTHRKGYLLDVGCGEGALLNYSGLKGIGVDLHPDRLALAKDAGIASVHADGNTLPFQNDTFSTVVSMEVLEHVPDMQVMMKEVHRILDVGGMWVISVPSVTLRSLHKMKKSRKAIYLDEKEHYREFSAVDIPWFENRFMKTSDFEQMLKETGFSMVRRDGLFYQLPSWFLPWGFFQKLFETPLAHRIFSKMPVIRNYPYWYICVVKKDENV